jgi:hypothetical protein
MCNGLFSHETQRLDIPEYTDPRTGDSDPPQKVLVL